jgi:hypothetical protein
MWEGKYEKPKLLDVSVLEIHNFPANSFGRSPENWSSPSLRSGEALNIGGFAGAKRRRRPILLRFTT